MGELLWRDFTQLKEGGAVEEALVAILVLAVSG